MVGAPLAAQPQPVLDKTWPRQAVRLVVPFAAGGSTSVAANTLAADISRVLGQAVNVELMPGNATITATDMVAKSTDGHTVLMVTAPYVINPSLYAKLPYDNFKDFLPASLLLRNGMVLVTPTEGGFKDFKEFLAAAKGTEPLRVANAGNGGMGHMAGELLAADLKLNIAPVPHRGAAPALNELLAGRIKAMFDNPGTTLQLIREGKLKALAYSG